MKVLSGIHEPTKGTITINNVNYDKLDHKLAASSASALFIRNSALLMN
jgi:ABC-type sugar transport system ATPase subunit